MTDSTNQPAGKGAEIHPPDAPVAENQMLNDYLALGSHPLHTAASTPSDKSAPPPHPAAATDNRSHVQALEDGAGTAGKSTLVGFASMMGASGRSTAEMADKRAHNAGTDQSPNFVKGLFNTGAGLVNMAIHPADTASGVWTGVKKAADTAVHGTTNQKLELLGGAAVVAGTFLVPAAGGLGKLGAEGKAATLAEQGLAEANSARSIMGDYRTGEQALSRVAATRVQEVAAVKLAPEAALAERQVVAAVEHATPATTTANIGAKLDLRALEPVAPPSLASRVTSNLTSRFKSIFSSGEGAVGESTVNRIPNLNRENQVGSLATRVDGLRSGEATSGGVRVSETFGGVRSSEAIGGVEPIKVQGRPAVTSAPEGTVVESKLHTDPHAEVPALGQKPPAVPVSDVQVVDRTVHIAPAPDGALAHTHQVAEGTVVPAGASFESPTSLLADGQTAHLPVKPALDGPIAASHDLGNGGSILHESPVNPLEAPVLTPKASHLGVDIVAGRATENIESLTRLTSEKGITLSPEAERGLADLSSQLKTAARSPEASLSLSARTDMAQQIAAVEQSLAASGAAADVSITSKFSELKATVNELAPSAVAPIAPTTEAPVVLASKAGQNLQELTRLTSERGLTLAPEVEHSLENINARITAMGQQGAVPLTAQASAELTQDLAVVERSLGSSGADAVGQKFSQLKASVSDLSKAQIEREHLGSLQTAMTTLEAQGTELSTSIKGLSQKLEEMPALSTADKNVASAISTRLEAIETKLAQDALVQTPVTTSSEIQQVVRELDRPEYTRFIADKPEAAEAFRQLKTSTTALVGTSSKVEAAEIGIGGIRQAEVFQQNVDGLAALSKELQVGLPATEASQPVSAALKNIEGDLATIKGGANPEAVLRRVHANIETIEGAGATDVANNLKKGLGQLEETSTAMDRTRRLETTVSTIQTEGSALETQSARLSEKFANDAVTAPSTSAVVPARAQISEQLQLISRQAKLLDASEAGANAVTKIKDAFNRVEELSAQEALSTEQTAALDQMKGSINRIDQASVEATGLRRLESNAAQIAEQSTRVETLSAGIAKTDGLAVAEGSPLEQKLTAISQAAQDVRRAQTLEDQVEAVNKLATSVQEPELQTALRGNRVAARSLEELQVSTAQLHESVSFRAMERSTVVAEAEAENSVRAASALETKIENDALLVRAPEVKAAAIEYRQAAQAFANAADKNVAAAEMEQKLEALQTQIRTAAPTSTIVQSDEMLALQRSQTAVSQSAADSELMSRSLIDRRLPVIENRFDQIAQVKSTVVQRELMRDLSDQIQGLRYLEGRSGVGADQLAQAQMQLARGQNDLEVATYRSNLVKLAAAGDQTATDRLLISGLTSDGYKATSMASASGPAARLVEDFARSHANLQGLSGQTSYSLRALASSDPLFANNPNLLSKAMRGTGYTLIGGGTVSMTAGFVRDARERAERRDNAAATAAVQAGQAVQAVVAAAQSAALSAVQSGARVGAGLAAVPASGASDSRVIGHSASEPNGFSPNGQVVARSAFSNDLAGQALPRSASSLGTTGDGANNFQPALTQLSADARSPYALTGPFPILKSDVNAMPMEYRIEYSGNIWGAKFGGAPAAASEAMTALTMAQTVHIGGGGGRSAKNEDLAKPATSQFVMPSTSLSSPFALGLGVAPRRDGLTTRLGGGAYGGAGITSRAVDTSSLKLASLSDADAEEGGTGAGPKNLKHAEKTEGNGIDSNAAHAGGAPMVAQNGGNNDDEDHGHTDPTVAGTTPTPVVPGGATGSVVPGGAPVARRVPPPANPGQSPVVAMAQGDDKTASAQVGAPPPRRRAATDAMSA